MSVKVTYKGAEIANINTNITKSLKTGGKYCEADIVLQNTQDGGEGSGGDYNIKSIDDGEGGQILHITDADGAKVIEPLSVSENGTYEVPDGVDGFGPVMVDVTKLPPLLAVEVTEYTQAEDWLTTSTGGLGNSFLVYAPRPATGWALYYVVNMTPTRITREFDGGVVVQNAVNAKMSDVLWRGNFTEARNFTSDTAVYIQAGTKLKVWKFTFDSEKEWAKENVN